MPQTTASLGSTLTSGLPCGQDGMDWTSADRNPGFRRPRPALLGPRHLSDRSRDWSGRAHADPRLDPDFPDYTDPHGGSRLGRTLLDRCPRPHCGKCDSGRNVGFSGEPLRSHSRNSRHGHIGITLPLSTSDASPPTPRPHVISRAGSGTSSSSRSSIFSSCPISHSTTAGSVRIKSVSQPDRSSSAARWHQHSASFMR